MVDRKSGRARRLVDYSKFASEGDDDDDFATPTPPRAKKKEVKPKKEALKSEKKPTSSIFESSRPKKDRRPPSDIEYEKELELALKLSAQETSIILDNGTETDSSQDVGEICGTDMTVVAEVTPPALTKVTSPPTNTDLRSPPALSKENLAEESEKENSMKSEASRCPGVSLHDTDTLEVLDSAGDALGRSARRGVKRAALDDDWDNSDSASESEASTKSWGDDEDDSDFDSGKNSKTKKKSPPKPKVQKQTKKKSPLKQKAKKPVLEARPVPNKVNLPAKIVTTPKTGRTLSGLTKACSAPTMVKTPVAKSTTSRSFVSPAPSPGLSSCHKTPLGGISIKSPGSGGMRLGLSKKARVKSLHPSVVVKH